MLLFDSLDNERSRQTTSNPPNTINRTPGNKESNGVSLKKYQPSRKENGIPKYSNGDKLLGSVMRYAVINRNTAVPPAPPIAIKSSQSLALARPIGVPLNNINTSAAVNAPTEP